MSDSEEDMVLAACAIIIIAKATEQLQSKRRKKKRWWTRQLFKSREKFGGVQLLNDLNMDDSHLFFNFNRMSAVDFENLIQMVGPKIHKQDTNYRKAVSVKERLAITLRFLATGDSYTSLMYLFKVSKQLISTIVPTVCEVLIEELREYIKMPHSKEQWLVIAKEFEECWQFPHCIGAIDGKHVVIQAPIHTGSEFFNYKHTFSIVLMAAVDAQYNFIFADVGCQGRISDGGVFKHTVLGQKLADGTLNLPDASCLPGTLPPAAMPIPYVFVADDAFSLHLNMMKPFSGTQENGSPKRIYNYRVSRARRIVENAFGIISAVFRVLRKPILLQPQKATKIVLACLYLHNFLRRSQTSRNIYTPDGTFDTENPLTGEISAGSWRQEVNNLTSFLPLKRTARKAAVSAQTVREKFCEYFSSEQGRIPWQEKYQ